MLFVAALACSAGSALGQSRPPAGYAPPGRLVDIGGRKLHLFTTGSRGPTVVVEAGSGDFSFDWTMVQGPVSEFARITTYDRAGYAWSDPGPTPRTFRQIALELHTALRRAHVPGPYVLVGHSYGGFLVRAFAKYYPLEVVGMVLVESMHEDSRVHVGGGHIIRIREEAKGRPFPEPRATGKGMAASPLVYPASGAALPEVEAPFDRLPADAKRLQAWASSQKRMEEARGAELEWSSEELARMWADPKERDYPLGDMPLVVITRRDGGYEDGPEATGKELDDERMKLQRDLARLSRNSRHVVDAITGHNVNVEDPQAVVAAIRDVVDAARTHRKLSATR